MNGVPSTPSATVKYNLPTVTKVEVVATTPALLPADYTRWNDAPGTDLATDPHANIWLKGGQVKVYGTYFHNSAATTVQLVGAADDPAVTCSPVTDIGDIDVATSIAGSVTAETKKTTTLECAASSLSFAPPAGGYTVKVSVNGVQSTSNAATLFYSESR